MNSQDRKWCKSLSGVEVAEFRLCGYVGAGKVGFVYRAERREPPGATVAIKLRFDSLPAGWEEELRKVATLGLVEDVVHFHDLGTAQVRHKGTTRLCQYTVWDYIAPGRNLKDYLKSTPSIDAGFLVAVVERILRVLHACRELGVARHGDLHAGNILIGNPSNAHLDDSLRPRVPVYVSDFGYGATGGQKAPKDDYRGLSEIINGMIRAVDYASATGTHRTILQTLQRDLGRMLLEQTGTEIQRPIALLTLLHDIRRTAQRGSATSQIGVPNAEQTGTLTPGSVGQFQVSEMIGERWDLWQRLFVPTVPRSSEDSSTGHPYCGHRTTWLREDDAFSATE